MSERPYHGATSRSLLWWNVIHSFCTGETVMLRACFYTTDDAALAVGEHPSTE